MLMTRTERNEKSHENHINPRKTQQEKTEKNKVLLKEVPLDVAVVLNKIEVKNIRNVCKKYNLID